MARNNDLAHQFEDIAPNRDHLAHAIITTRTKVQTSATLLLRLGTSAVIALGHRPGVRTAVFGAANLGSNPSAPATTSCRPDTKCVWPVCLMCALWVLFADLFSTKLVPHARLLPHGGTVAEPFGTALQPKTTSHLASAKSIAGLSACKVCPKNAYRVPIARHHHAQAPKWRTSKSPAPPRSS